VHFFADVGGSGDHAGRGIQPCDVGDHFCADVADEPVVHDHDSLDADAGERGVPRGGLHGDDGRGVCQYGFRGMGSDVCAGADQSVPDGGGGAQNGGGVPVVGGDGSGQHDMGGCGGGDEKRMSTNAIGIGRMTLFCRGGRSDSEPLTGLRIIKTMLTQGCAGHTRSILGFPILRFGRVKQEDWGLSEWRSCLSAFISRRKSEMDRIWKSVALAGAWV
jgi:hypothetical protein